jgi:hypothetical protein
MIKSMGRLTYSEMGILGGAKVRAKSIAEYNANPNICIECGVTIFVCGTQKVSTVRQKKFCSQPCVVKNRARRCHEVHRLAVGSVFNRLTVEGEVYREAQNLYLYVCRCVCGKQVTARRDFLISGVVKSCGCWSRDNAAVRGSARRLPDGLASLNKLMRSYRVGAKKRGYAFTLTDDQMKVLFKSDCSYCGRPPSQVADNANRDDLSQGYVYTGIDRIDSLVGYTFENSAPACRLCNFMKGQLSLEQFKNAVVRVAKHLGLLEC